MSLVLEFPGRHDEQRLAAAWIARLDRGLHADERVQLAEWLRREPRHRAALLEFAALWDRMDVLAEMADLFPLREERAAQRWTAVRVLAMGSVTLLAVVASLFAMRFHEGRVSAYSENASAAPPVLGTDGPLRAATAAAFTASYATAVGEQRSFELPDHSIIQLNTNTALRVEFTTHARHIEMWRGEADFQVAKNAARVFTVQVGGIDFNAVGTAFNIRADLPQGVRLTVTEGRVRVNHAGTVSSQLSPAAAGPLTQEFVDVDADNELLVDRSGILGAVVPAQVAAATAWQSRMIVFDATPLQQVVNELGRYTTTRFVIADPELEVVPVSGYFKVGDVDALSAALERNFGIQVRKSGDTVRLSVRAQK